MLEVCLLNPSNNFLVSFNGLQLGSKEDVSSILHVSSMFKQPCLEKFGHQRLLESRYGVPTARSPQDDKLKTTWHMST